MGAALGCTAGPRIAAPGCATGLRPYVPPLLAVPRCLRPLRAAAPGHVAGLWPLRPAGCSQPGGRPASGPCAQPRAAHRPLPRAARFAVEATGEEGSDRAD